MIFILSCSCLRPIHWSQVSSREWRFSWSSAYRRCSNYICVVNKFIAYYVATYIRGLTVIIDKIPRHTSEMHFLCKRCWYQSSKCIWNLCFQSEYNFFHGQRVKALWPSNACTVWYKTKFGSQNFGYQIWWLFCNTCNVFKNMFNMSLIIMW